MLSNQQIADFQEQGVVVLRGVFKDWISTLSRGADYNVNHPSPRAITHRSADYKGRFFEDFCNWKNIKEYREFVEQSSMATIAAALMRSERVQFFHDHYLDKEAVSGVATPWHQDMPYYFVEGMQNVSFWIPLDAREKHFSLKSVAGSHLWPKLVMPTKWSNNAKFYPDSKEFMQMPDIDNGDYDIRSWEIEPGDVVAFNFRTVHAANANTLNNASRTISFRLVGDDARYVRRPDKTSPDYPNINQKNGERLRADWFPFIYN